MNKWFLFVTLQFVLIYSQKISKSKFRSVKMRLVHANVSLFTCYCSYLHVIACITVSLHAFSVCLAFYLSS